MSEYKTGPVTLLDVQLLMEVVASTGNVPDTERQLSGLKSMVRLLLRRTTLTEEQLYELPFSEVMSLASGLVEVLSTESQEMLQFAQLKAGKKTDATH